MHLVLQNFKFHAIYFYHIYLLLFQFIPIPLNFLIHLPLYFLFLSLLYLLKETQVAQMLLGMEHTRIQTLKENWLSPSSRCQMKNAPQVELGLHAHLSSPGQNICLPEYVMIMTHFERSCIKKLGSGMKEVEFKNSHSFKYKLKYRITMKFKIIALSISSCFRDNYKF